MKGAYSSSIFGWSRVLYYISKTNFIHKVWCLKFYLKCCASISISNFFFQLKCDNPFEGQNFDVISTKKILLTFHLKVVLHHLVSVMLLSLTLSSRLQNNPTHILFFMLLLHPTPVACHVYFVTNGLSVIWWHDLKIYVFLFFLNLFS